MQIGPARYSLLPPVIKNLIIINILMFLATITVARVYNVDLNDYLALFFPLSEHFAPYQFITSMFMHGDVTHIFFNLFTLWMFGTQMENRWGSKKFLTFYMVTGIGAGLLYSAVNLFQYYQLVADLGPIQTEAYRQAFSMMRVIGASGAVYGVLMAVGLTYPNQLVYLYFAIPIRMKWLVIGLGVMEFMNGFSHSDSGIAHFAHLGGMLFGFLLIKYWNKRRY